MCGKTMQGALSALAIVCAASAGGAAGEGARGNLFDRRIGLFVHWGIYAVDGYHEQQRMRQRMGRADYERRLSAFTAEAFDADAFGRCPRAACRRRGLRFGLYYSNPDWHHPNAYNPKSTHQVSPEVGDRPDLEAYRAYVRAQLTELLANESVVLKLDFGRSDVHAPLAP